MNAIWIAIDWLASMSPAEKISVILSVVAGAVGVWTLRTNRSMAETNKTMAEANSVMADTAKASVELAEQANVLAQRSVDDQIETNRVARSASIRIVAADFETLPEARRVSQRDPEAGVVSGDRLTGFLTLTLFHDGAAPAFHVRVVAMEYENRTRRERQIWRRDDPGSHFASLPFKMFPYLQPTETKTCKFAVRTGDESEDPSQSLRLEFKIEYTDSFGLHSRQFEIRVLGMDVLGVIPSPIHENPISNYFESPDPVLPTT